MKIKNIGIEQPERKAGEPEMHILMYPVLYFFPCGQAQVLRQKAKFRQ